MGFQKRHQAFESLRVDQGIGVEQEQVLSPRQTQRLVHGSSEACVSGVHDQEHLWEPGCQHVLRAVCRAIIHHDDLEVSSWWI